MTTKIHIVTPLHFDSYFRTFYGKHTRVLGLEAGPNINRTQKFHQTDFQFFRNNPI